MLQPSPFPTSVDQLTPELLGEALDSHVSDWSAIRIGADRGMLGSIHLITPTYALGSTGPPQLVAKFAAPRAGSLASARRGRTHERELRFFDELRDLTPVSTPQHYGTWYDDETAEFLLLQSAVDADESVDQLDGLSVDDAAMVLSEVAQLHARWWDDPQLHAAGWLPRLDSAQRVNNLTTIAAAGTEPLAQLLDEEVAHQVRAVGAELPARLEQALHELAQLPSTLIHSDLRADNLLFAPNRSKVTLIDWQGCGIGPVGFDLAYFLTQSLRVEDRRAHEPQLLDHYRESLAHAGVTVSHEDVLEGYSKAFVYGLVIACALPLIGDAGVQRLPRLAATMTRRALAAMDDYGQLWETTT